MIQEKGFISFEKNKKRLSIGEINFLTLASNTVHVLILKLLLVSEKGPLQIYIHKI